jgi:hypothetical protein
MPPSDTAFLVGADLVEFDRRDLPIYATPVSPWADAGCELLHHGAPLDRLFGEPGEIHVTGAECCVDHVAAADLTALLVDDPLVVMSALNDGLMLPLAEHDRIASLDDSTGVTLQAGSDLPHAASLCDFGTDFRGLLPLADGWHWDLDKAGWVIDHHG